MVAVLVLLSGFTSLLTTSAQSETPPDKPFDLSTEAGDTQVRLSWDDPEDDSITDYQLWQLAQSEKLTAGTNDDFGYSVAVVGDEAVVGMPEDDDSQDESGAVIVFTRDSDGGWTQTAKLKASDPAQDDEFGSSVAFDGTTIVAGAPFDDHGGLGNAGSAYVFTKPTTGWANGTETAKLTAPNAAAEDEFGNSVAVDGDTVVVGAYGRDVSTGVTYVFTKPSTDANSDGSIDWQDWGSLSDLGKATLTATLTAGGAESGDEFGYSVAVDSNTIVVGASGDDGTALQFVGSAFAFVEPDSGGWVSTSTAAKLTASTRGDNDYFGRSVAIDGDTIVVGADEAENTMDVSQVETGSAYVFTKPGTGWATDTETAKLTASDSAATDKFGYAVALDGDTVVVGAYGNDSSMGSAYVFTKPASGWADGTEAAQLTASDRATNDRFASSVAVDGDTIVVGAENNDAAYVFDIVDWEEIAGSNAATKSHIVRRLTNDTAYAFRVRAVNTFGASDPSDYVSETPKAAAYAPARPRNFSATQTGDGEVELTWDAHRYPLTVTGYAYYQDDGGGPNWTDIDGSDSSTVSHTVTGLTAVPTYTFAVRAVNGAGSTESDSRSLKLSEAPAAPDSFSAVAGDGQVWLGWRSPADFTISGYEYRQKEGTDAFGDWQTIPGSRTGSTFHIVTGLTNDISYTFQVRAVNAAGESGSSGEQSATPATASSAPVKPEGFAARQTGIGQVELTWGASSNPLNVTGYQFKQDSRSWTTISESDHSTVSHIITGLTQGVTYTFRVRAVNIAGSTESAPQSVTVVDKPAEPDPFAAEAGDTQVRLTWNDPDNASITKYRLWQFPPTSIRLTSDDRAGLDELGWSVAVDGDTLVIGALGDEPRNTGAAYVFTRDARGWVQVSKLAAENRADPFAGDDAGFGHSVAVHGDTIVVGAYEENHPATTTNAGAAYVFTKSATGWADMTQTARLTASDAVANDEFGTSVAVHGDTIVVGAPEKDVNPDDVDDDAKGSAYIFTRPADGWADMTETAALRGQSNGDRFGRSVALHGDTVVVGAFEENGDRGAAYVFTKRAATGVWVDWNYKKANDATARLTASDRASGDRFGRAVAMDGDTIVVGAPFDDDDGDSSGSAYVFIKPASGSWVSTSTAAKLTASDGAEDDQFGFSVAVDGNTVVVGADGDDSNRGSAYVFTKPPNGWTVAAGTDKRTIYDRRGDDRFGKSVAVDGDTVLVGAVGDDSGKGSAYVFGTGWADIPDSGAETTSHIATRLPNRVEHTFRVRAVNAAGAGDASDAVMKTPTKAGSAPDAPADFTATQTGVGKVLLEWKPSDSPLTVSRYQFTQNAGDKWADIHGSDSSTVSHTVTGLTAGTKYTFAVRAVNGAGQESSVIKDVTIVALPQAASGLTSVAGDEQVKLSWDNPSANSPPISKYQSLQIDPSKLFASDGAAYDEFGISIAVVGDIAVVGARQDDTRNGSAYVFTKVSGVWSQVAQLTASDGAADDEFGYSVAVDGDTIVVGAHQNDADTNDNDEGAAYVFTKPALGWGDWSNLDTNGKAVLTTKLTAFGTAAGDEFGISVAVDGDTILVGAHLEDANDDDTDPNNNVTDSGAAYIFTKFSGVWGNAPVSGNHRVETAKLVAAGAAADDEFGISVALDGDTAVIGTRKDDDNGNQSGSAYVFTKVSGVWSQKAKLIASDGAADDEFGISVAVDGDTIVVGAHQNDADTNNNDEGAAYLFTEPASGWVDMTQKAKLTASDAAANDEFGISVAVNGDTIVVGAHQNDADTNNNDEGAAYLFTEPASGWADMTQKAKHTASDGAAEDRYGYSVGVSGDTIVVGAPYNDYDDTDGDTNDDEGAAYFLSVLDWADIPDSGAATTTIVTGLTNDEEHTFQVRGANAAGGGLASAGAGGTPMFAIPDPPDGLTADAGDAVVDLSWVDPEDSTIDKYQLLQITQGDKLTAASTGDPVVRGDGFGISVAMDGNTAVVGAYQDDDATNDNSGSAHVFTRSSSAAPWSWSAKLTASDAAANDEFGIAVAVDGDTIVIGARQDDTRNGWAYVFTWNSSNSKWEQKAKFTASDAAANDEFGISVAVDGGTVVVGAHKADYIDLNNSSNNLADSGAAYVFTKPESGGWADATETAKLTASDAAANDEFGISVAVHGDAVEGDTVVVGAHLHDANTISNAGAVYVFEEPSDGWVDATETAKLTASDGAASDEFGISVAVDGDTVVLGAHKYDVDDNGTSIPNAGAAYVFIKPTGGPWADGTETAKLIASDAVANDEFGISVAIDDDTIVVGAYLDDDNGDNSGSAYVFSQDSNGWSQKTKLTGPSRGKGYWLGHSVAVVGNTVIAGAGKSNISGPDSGAVYLWTVPGWTDIANSDATTTSLTVTGLTNRVEYSLQVRAVDKVEWAGAGPPSEVRATPLKPKPAKPTGLSAAPGDTQVRLSWDLPGESSPPINSYQLWQHAENAILTADTREANDEFGYAVAIDGDTAVVGMPGEDNPDNSGAAFVYTMDSFGTWSQVARLRASDPVDNVDGDGDDDNDEHRFGLSVAVHEDTSNGDTIVVGAPDHSDSKGAVYVFSEPSNGWANDTDSDDPDTDVDHITETAKFLASDGAAEDEFGNSVAVDGNTIVVGAHNKNAAYIFTRPATGWANDTKTPTLSGSGSSSFGRSVAIDGDTIVVGASEDDSGKGSAFVFIEPDTGWANSPGTEVAKLTAYSGKVNDRFGRSVAIDGGTIVVGAHQPTYQDGSETIKQPGAAYVFMEPDTGWTNSPGTETAKLTASDGDGGDQFGFSVAVDGDTVVIGADALNETKRSGSAYVFTKPAAGWVDITEAAKLTGSGTANRDRFGLSVAVDGATVMVGANGQGDDDQGAAYVYGIQDWSPTTGSTGETTSQLVTGLTNDVKHTFAVRAVNDGGESVPSDQTSETPAGAASLPIKPRNFSAVQFGAGEVRLEWERSVQPLTIVRFDYTADGGSNWPRAVGSHSTTASYTVSDLTVGTTYTFAVRAVNSAGEGVSSDPWSVTIAAAPDRPTALRHLAGDEQVQLSWRYSGSQTSITGFQYQQKTGGDFGDDWTDIIGSTAVTRSHIVTGLTNDTTYTFRVRAVNVTIGSDTTNEEDATPSASGSHPARPTNFNAEQTGVGQVELTWDTAGARLTVTGYQYTADDGSNWSDISGSDSGTVSHIVSGLMVDTMYTFAVRAVNSGMLLDFSSSFHDVTIIDVPNIPTGLGTTSGDTQATFHWNVTVETTDRPIKHQLLHLPQSKLTADDRAANDRAANDEFGYSVAIDGNTAVVGAPGSNGNAGAAYVFVFTEADDDDGGAWSQVAKLTASDGASTDEFGYSVAVDGDTIVVGAHLENANDDDVDTTDDVADSGAAYVFTKPESGGWADATETAKLTAFGAAESDEFGISVAVHGETVVVGAHLDDHTDGDGDTDDDEGAAYVFTKPGSGGWADATETAKLTAFGTAESDEFGISVAVHGETVVVGAHLDDHTDGDGDTDDDEGAAYVFTKPATDGWTDNTEGAKFTAPDGAANDEFGVSVAIDVDAVVVGAHLHDVGANANAGAAYVFTRDSNSGKWGQPLKLTASNGHADDGFGNSVAVDGNTAAVGAYLDDRDAAARDTGSTYVFARKLGVWSQTLNLAGPGPDQNDRLGYSVAVDDGTLLAGAPQDDNNPDFAYAMDISDAEWTDFVSTELTDNGEDYFYRVLNLTNDQEYAFRVRSVNAAANRPSNETVAATPKSAKPGKTDGLSAQPGDSQVTLSWDDPRDSSLTGYQVLRPPEQTKFTAGSDGERNGAFGASVAVDDAAVVVGGTAVVGAPKHNVGSKSNAGAAYVFTEVDGVWSGPVKLIADDGAENDWFGYSVAVEGNVAVIGAYQHDTNDNADAGAAYVFIRDPLTGVWSEPVKLIADDGAENDWFGYSVAVDGETIVVGARWHNGKAGAAYIFTRNSMTRVWGNDLEPGETHRVETAKLTASDGGAFNYFGHSVAVDGETIVIGAPGYNANTGVAYVFTRNSMTRVWGNDPEPGETHRVETAKLTAFNGHAGDGFGNSVAVDGETIVVGAQQGDGERGSAYVFTEPTGDGGWADNTETAKLAASDRELGDHFGNSVAVRGGSIVVGAYTANINECDECGENLRSGAAYLFTKPADAVWANDPNKDYGTESGKLTLPTNEEERGDEFGNSVALDGQSVVVGAPEGNDGFGSVYVSDIPQWAFLASAAETTSATVEGLTNGVEYTFQVRAVDFYGGGPPSDIARATPMPAPDVPTNFTATAQTASVRLAWDDPDDSGITRYEYRQASGDGNFGPATTIRGSSAMTTSHTVRDLINRLYRFQIRAVNVYGAGDWSPSFNATPRAPNRGTPYFIGRDSVTFTVDENTSPGTPVGSALTATDPDGDTLSYSLSGTDASSFGIDRSTGQLIVKHPLDFETQSVYEVTVWVSDDRNASDDVDVTITITNVDEAGTVSVSLEQPEVGTALVVSLSDLDGLVSNISWQWARSSDGSNWSDTSGANSDSYTPVADDVGIYLQAVASYTDGHGPGKSAHAVMERQTAQRGPSFEGDVTFTVGENTPPGSLVGDAITATDPDGDVLTYSLSGIDASSFVLDGSTGQITVGSGILLDYESGPTRHTVVVSVHDGRGAYGDDDSTIDDLIEVSIDVSNVDEAGTVSVSLEQPEVGTALVVSLSDLDGLVSNISWQWARSSDGSNWSDISGANSDSYTPVADDVGIYLQAVASYTDGHGPGKSAHAVMERQTAQRGPSFEGDVTFTVDENTPPGSLVGDAITATDPDGDVLTYSLSGIDASSFVLDGSTGQITVGSGTLLDYESGPTRYTVVVSVHDGRGAYGDDDSTIDDLIEVSIDVSNVDEAGTVSVSLEQPEVGTALVVSLSDLDGLVSNISWQWARSSDGSNWSDISGANSDSYTPVADDAGIYLQAVASYTDGHGPGKSAHAVMERQTAQRGPSFEGDVTFTVDENTPPGSLVGDAITATDPDGDVLTYSLSGIDASSFVLDGSTGQITVGSGTLLDYESGPTRHTVVVSVHDGRGAYGDDDSTIDDLIEVSIDVSNVDEAGTVSVSLEQPEVGTALVVSLSDLDGLVSNISWQWARSSDGSNWSDISGANSDSYTPVADDAGIYLQAVASYTDGHGPGKFAHAVMERQTAQRGPSFEGDVTFTVDENTPPGSLVGDAITATDPDGDVLTYSLSGIDASSFVLDGSTGQITVGSGTLLDYESGPTRYTVVVSVHDGRGAYGDDDSTIDDLIEVSIDVSNVDEAGTVSVSLEQPEVGTALVVSLSDLDGLVSNISWQWARSSDGSNWSDISGANSDSYTPVADDAGIYLQAVASYTDGHGPGKSAHAVMERQTAQRGPSFEGDVTFTVDENTPPGSLVGDAITATDPDGDVLTYSLSGIDASSFVLDGSTGQITVGSGILLDYESGPTRHTVVVSVHDGRGAYGDDDSTIDDLIEVSIDVSNVDEAGTVSVSLEQPEVGTALVVSLSDLDGLVSNISWQWARSSDRANWQDTAGASSSTYTPVDLDADKYLRVTASYADGEGSGKQAQAVLNNPVQGLPELVATPTTTATDTAEPPPSEADGGDEGFPWWVIVAVVIGVVAGVVLIIVVLRSRR